MRERFWYAARYLTRWERLAPLPAALGQADEARLALALCHRDGRIRQEALEWAVGHPALLPLIVIRCADWAAPVRERARSLLRGVLGPEAAVRLTPLALQVGRRDRGGFGVETIEASLRGASRDDLAPLLAAPDRSVRRFAHRFAVDRGLLSLAELAQTAAHDTDPAVQDVCATAALAALRHDRSFDVVLPLLLSARNPRTRAAGVTALRSAGRTQQAVGYLGDRSGLVRACARYVLRTDGIDPVRWYRQQVAAPDDAALRPGAVIGLAECGDRADAALLRPLLVHPAAGVRARAVAGLRELECATTQLLRPLLDDPASAVVRETVIALLPSARALPADWLLEHLDAERARHIRLGAFRLLDARGGTEALRAAAELLHDPDPKLRFWAGQCVRRWRPTADAPRGDAEVEELLERTRHLFGPEALRRVKWEAGIAG
ncbi:hypothetical protein GTY65_00715 [Streptomyces sp. SID8379]|nr:hypothetical protein [Streptomyces sp. SID8379]